MRFVRLHDGWEVKSQKESETAKGKGRPSFTETGVGCYLSDLYSH
jgi:hypothetical protein